MKLLGNLLLTISLVTAMLAAATSYIAFVDGAPPERFEEEEGHTRLRADAGLTEADEADLLELEMRRDAGTISGEEYVAQRRAVTAVMSAALDESGTRLTGERLAELQSAGVETVFVKEFAFSRWRYWWVFLLSAIGLFAGSMMVRRAEQEQIRKAVSGEDEARSPEAALTGIVDVLAELDNELAELEDPFDELGEDDDKRLSLIRARIEEAQREHLPVFVDGRPILVGRLGLGGYAELMDRFAAGERQLNRAWSAAADGVLAESLTCLDLARTWMEEAERRLAAG